MILDHFFQGDLNSRPEAVLQELLRAILVRANFVPAVRHHIGWRGVKQATADGECWTAKISGFAGVFGLSFNGLEACPGWLRGRFLVYYFPDPNEDLVEGCSLKAAAWTHGPDYLEHVRDFPSHPEPSRLFTIGLMGLAVDAAGKALTLDLESLSSQRSIAEDGVFLPGNGKRVPMIEPGGRDQDFPAMEVASGLFNTVAASATFNLGQPPVYLSERRFPATQIFYNCTGAMRSVAAADVWQYKLLLGYGEGRFEELEADDHESNQPPAHCLRWCSLEPLPPEYQYWLCWSAHQLHAGTTIDKKFVGIDERPPLIILTGFLGAGKTSFLQHFIEYQTQRSRFVAVIQNEIGEVGLDGKLLDYTVTEIDEGCVCCSLVGNLKRAVHGILESFSPDTIILETSGMANPKNLLDELGELAEWVRFDATVTVVDALNSDASLKDYAIASDQISAADVLILNKSDLVSEGQLRDLHQRLQQLNPQAPIVESCWGDVNPAMIFEVEGRLAPAATNICVPPTDGEGRQPPPTHAHDHLWSRTMRLSQVLDRQAFLEAVALLPSSIFRVKGLIEVSDPRETLLFQYVAGRWDINPFPDTRSQERFLTFIGKNDDPNSFDTVEELIRTAEA